MIDLFWFILISLFLGTEINLIFQLFLGLLKYFENLLRLWYFCQFSEKIFSKYLQSDCLSRIVTIVYHEKNFQKRLIVRIFFAILLFFTVKSRYLKIYEIHAKFTLFCWKLKMLYPQTDRCHFHFCKLLLNISFYSIVSLFWFFLLKYLDMFVSFHIIQYFFF